MPEKHPELSTEELKSMLKERQESNKKIKGPLINELNVKFNECLNLFQWQTTVLRSVIFGG